MKYTENVHLNSMLEAMEARKRRNQLQVEWVVMILLGVFSLAGIVAVLVCG